MVDQLVHPQVFGAMFFALVSIFTTWAMIKAARKGPKHLTHAEQLIADHARRTGGQPW